MKVLEASDVLMVFGNFPVGASLTVAESEFHGLIGPNGSGKSTFMKCVAGALTTTGGRITLRGCDLDHLDATARARAG